jgi:hypothetical protein
MSLIVISLGNNKQLVSVIEKVSIASFEGQDNRLLQTNVSIYSP